MSNLYWQEENDDAPVEADDDVVDIVYRLDCKTLPIDHAQPLSDALHEALPWIADEDRVAIHNIHIAEAGNGWFRDENDGLLQLSRRTRFTLRVPAERVDDARALEGMTLDIDGHPMTIGAGSVKKLSKLTTIFSRYMAAEDVDDEGAYLERIYNMLMEKGIKPKKMMAGRKHVIQTTEGPLPNRMLMLAELDIDASLKLQKEGLGPGRKLGCGIFIPHKGIEAVNKEQKNR